MIMVAMLCFRSAMSDGRLRWSSAGKVSCSVSIAVVSGLPGGAVIDLRADIICSTAVAIVCFSDVISDLRDRSSLA